MFQVAQIQIAPWDQVHQYKIGDLKLEIGNQVVVKTDFGTEVGQVVGSLEISEKEATQLEEGLKPILRKVTTEDLNKIAEQEKQKQAAIDYCRQAADRFNLPMKIIDAHFSLDGGRLTFPFIADSRVDFRELVKNLTHHFQKSIRLQQIGIRDEAKIAGDFGSCGRRLCCRDFLNLKELGSITSELAESQQISHRGSERLTGLCGRLRCCLAFEKKVYQELMENLPPVGSIVQTPQGQGEVVGWHTLRQTVDVALSGDQGNIVEVEVKQLKVKQRIEEKETNKL